MKNTRTFDDKEMIRRRASVNIFDEIDRNYFADAVSEAICAEKREAINELYTKIAGEFVGTCFWEYPELLTLWTKTPDKILLGLRKVYHKRVWHLFQHAVFCKEKCTDELTPYEVRCFKQFAKSMLFENVIDEITLEKFNNILDKYDIRDFSIGWIVKDLFKTIF